MNHRARRSRPVLSRLALGVLGALIAVSCSGGDPTIPTAAPADDALDADSSAGSSGQNDGSDDEDPESDEGEADGSVVLSGEATEITTRADLDGAGEAWVTMWRLVHDQAPESELRAVATAAGSAFLETDLQLGTLGVTRAFNLYPSSTVNADGSVTLEDCVLAEPSLPGGNVGLHLQADAEQLADGWVITQTSVVSREGCIPQTLAAQALAVYEAYWDAHVLMWNPADPDHPSLRDVAAGTHLERMTTLLGEFEGFEFRGRPETHPEVVTYGAIDEIVIADCQLTDPQWGIYDVATGARTTDVEPTFDGRRDGRVVTMGRIDGFWRVISRQGSENIDCEFAPTSAGLPLI